MAAHNIYPGFFYVGTAFQTTAGTAAAPAKFCRAASMSKAEETIKTEKLHDGLNREWAVNAKVAQYHEMAWVSQLYPDFFASALFHMYGITDLVNGTLSTGSSTVTGATGAAGSTSITVAAGTGFTTGQTVLVGTGGAALSELVTLGTVAGTTLPIAAPVGGLRYTHPAGAAVAGVTDPFTHTGSSTNAIPALMSFEHSIGQAPAPTNPMEVIRVPDGLYSNIKLDATGGKLAVATYGMIGRLGVPGQTAATVAFETDRPMTLADATFTFPAYVATPGLGFDIATGDVTHFMMDGKLSPDQVHGAGTLAPQMLSSVRDTSIEFDVYVPDSKLLREIWYGSPSSTVPITAIQNGAVTTKYDLGGTPDHFVQILYNNLLAESATPTYASDGKACILKCKGVAMPSGSTGALTVTVSNAFGSNYGWAGS
jgi:hypothetical protein